MVSIDPDGRYDCPYSSAEGRVRTENVIRVDGVMELPKLAE
jgi:hypothetical protein